MYEKCVSAVEFINVECILILYFFYTLECVHICFSEMNIYICDAEI